MNERVGRASNLLGKELADNSLVVLPKEKSCAVLCTASSNPPMSLIWKAWGHAFSSTLQ